MNGSDVDPLFPGWTVHGRSPRGRALLQSHLVWPAGTLGNRRDSVKKECQHPSRFILCSYPWNDAIDPSNVTGNRKKVWVYLLTIAIPENKILTSQNTYIISIGPGDEDHGNVERRIQADFELLSCGTYFYYDPWHSTINCVAIVYAHLADRPAKSASTCTLTGKSKFHTWFGFSRLLPFDTLPSCEWCHTRRKETILSHDLLSQVVICDLCHDWNFHNIRYAYPDSYPQSERTTPPSSLRVAPVTSQRLEHALTNVFDRVGDGTWTSIVSCWSYCRTFGIPVIIFNESFHHAFARRSYLQAEDKDAFFDHEELTMTRDQYEKRPTLPATFFHPLTDMEEWVCTIMHRIFLGIVKATAGDFLKDWLSTNHKFTSFATRTNTVLRPLKELRLSWAKFELLSSDGKFGRYVSENYMAYTRIVKWLYSDLDDVPSTDRDYNDPVDKELHEFTKKELQGWLTARGISYPSRLNKNELLSKIYDAVELYNGAWPPLRWFEHQTSSLELAEELIVNMIAMISQIIARYDISDAMAADTERHIKLFLTLVHQWDCNKVKVDDSDISTSHSTEEEPVWASQYNFITLLSIPSCQKKFGSLQLLWEGDGKGEGALPKIKSVIKSLNGNWALATANWWYTNRTLGRVTKNLLQVINNNGHKHPLVNFVNDNMGIDEENEEVDESISSSSYKDYHTYRDWDAFKVLFDSSSLLSIVRIRVGNMQESYTYGAVIRGESYRDRKYIAGLTFMNDTTTNDGFLVIESCRACYFQWQLCNEDSVIEFNEESLEMYCLLLPHHQNRNGDSFFYLINSEWEEMIKDRSITCPCGHDCYYYNTINQC